MTEPILSAQQREGIDKIKTWYESQGDWADPEPFRLFGAAGTGKTTTAKHIGEALGIEAIDFAAYTGKAARVLQSKGVPATTIHSAIYRPIGNDGTRALLAQARKDLEDAKESASLNHLKEGAETIEWLRSEVDRLVKEANTLGFEINDESAWNQSSLIVLDEVSMVNAKLAADIESFGVPVLVLGDPAQLPPIEGGGYYTNAEPDYELTEPQRFYLDSQVGNLATRVRTSSGTGLGLTAEDREPVSLARAMECDQVLVWKNATRWNLTESIRAKLGRPRGEVVSGDRVMCLTNNKDLGVMNGTQYHVLEVEPGQVTVRMLLQEADTDAAPRWLRGHYRGFGGQAAEADMKRNEITHRGQVGAFTFANVITVHKAQGSEWKRVYVVDQSGGVAAMARKEMGAMAAQAQARRWLYTAVTRAEDEVIIGTTGR